MGEVELILLVKKERLDKHLIAVEGLIGEWISQLSAVDPFASCTKGETWGWQCAYRPRLEEDPDSNHMLRRHLKSRALWRHHSLWVSKLGRVFELLPSVRVKATDRGKDAHQTGKAASKKEDRTEAYVGTALWQAFRLANNHRSNIDYTRGDYGKGVRFGGYLIQTPAASAEEFKGTCDEHRRLSYELSGLDEMKEMAQEWAGVERLQTQMRALAGRALKSSDFLYPCRFCKHLWTA